MPLAGCGADSNLLGLTVPDDQFESFEALLSQGHAAYDRNQLDEALKCAEKAYAMNPESERAAILFGLVNLSLAGGDPLELAKAMIANSKQKKEEEEAAAPAFALADTADTLGSLKTVLGITDEELELMATRDVVDPELPILIPGCVETGRQNVARLQHLNNAIVAICRFTDPEARVDTDYRQICESTTAARQYPHQAHFLWAFAHLTEALVFNSVLTYGSADPDGKKTNLEMRVDKLNSIDASTPAGLTALVGAVDTVSATLAAVMPVSGKCSEAAPTTQIRATLNDMLAVDAAFARMPGTPDKVASGIRKAMARIRSVQVASGTPITAQTKALKQDFSKKAAKTIAAKIDALGADPAKPLPAAEKTKLCGTLTDLAPDPSISTVCGTP